MTIQKGLRLLNQRIDRLFCQLLTQKSFNQSHSLLGLHQRIQVLLKPHARHTPEFIQRHAYIKQFTRGNPGKPGKHANAKTHGKEIEAKRLTKVNTSLAQTDQLGGRRNSEMILAGQVTAKMKIKFCPGSRQ